MAEDRKQCCAYCGVCEAIFQEQLGNWVGYEVNQLSGWHLVLFFPVGVKN